MIGRSITGVIALVLLSVSASRAATIVVDNTNVSGPGSLAGAIAAANATVQADTIVFDIAGTSARVISAGGLVITSPLTIDGYTKEGSSPNTLSTDATNAAVRLQLIYPPGLVATSVLRIDAGPTLIRGLSITGMPVDTAAIEVSQAVTNATIQGCFLGTNPLGQTDLSAGNGIVVRGGADIGGVEPAERNLISGNSGAGILILGSGSGVYGNLIGTDAQGNPDLGNGSGLSISGAQASDNDIGAPHLFSGNAIAGNSGAGIRTTADAGDGNTFRNNRIHHNGTMGIDLAGDGPTINDLEDFDSGPNDRQNYFEITSARMQDDKIRIEGYQHGPLGSYDADFFVSDAADPSGFGEGELRLAALALTLLEETRGHFAFEITPSVTLPPTPVVSAVSTHNFTGNSSEFSPAVPIVDGGTKLTVINTLNTGAGSLRAAVTFANAAADTNTIVFAIPGDGPHTIPLLTGLGLTSPVIIDGYTQGGAHPAAIFGNADIRVVLDGAGATSVSSGLVLSGPGSIVRGLAIGNYPVYGIVLAASADGTQVEGNYIGTDETATIDRGNGNAGVLVGEGGDDCVIGGPLAHQRNVIAANGGSGILNEADGTLISGNIIGTGFGRAALGNELHGIATFGSGLLIGGDGDAANRIVFNGAAGVRVFEGTGVDISGNSMRGNERLGIDLGSQAQSGVTPNDPDDADTGANELQNFPVLTEVSTSDLGFKVVGTVDIPEGGGGGTRVDLFAAVPCDDSGHGEGEELLATGFFELSDAADEFTFLLPIDVFAGTPITSTATDLSTRSTSEFSNCVILAPECGDANIDGALAAGDALIALRTAVGSDDCDPCICDANDSGMITAPDAQLILRAGVGQQVTLVCPACS